MATPVGFRFNPTEEELLGYFLKNKILGIPLMEWENNQFIEGNLYGENCNPWDLLKVDDEALPWQDVVDSVNKVVGSQKVLYVFTVVSNVAKNEKNAKQKNRVAGCGCWHGNSKAEPVRENHGLGKCIGKRAAFTFRSAQETIGQWAMTEYSIDAAGNGIPQNHQNYVLCKIKVDDSKTCMGGRVVARKRKFDVVNVEKYKLEKPTKKSVNCFETSPIPSVNNHCSDNPTTVNNGGDQCFQISNPTGDHCSEISNTNEEGTLDQQHMGMSLGDLDFPLCQVDQHLGAATNFDGFDSWAPVNLDDYDLALLPLVSNVDNEEGIMDLPLVSNLDNQEEIVDLPLVSNLDDEEGIVDHLLGIATNLGEFDCSLLPSDDVAASKPNASNISKTPKPSSSKRFKPPKPKSFDKFKDFSFLRWDK